MPKFKKKKSAVGADFKRVKSKVGKKLPKAQNATDTSFRSKQIVLGEQNIGQEKGEAVTASNLSLKDLLSQLSHFSEKVRRVAAQELRVFLLDFPEQLRLHLALCVERTAERLNDSDREVRERTLEVLSDAILGQLSQEALEPFAALLVAQCGRAATSLTAGARRHALRAIALVAKRAPRLLAGDGAGALSHAQSHAELLDHFRTLLATANRAASVAVSASSSAAAAATQVAASSQAIHGGHTQTKQVKQTGRGHVSPTADRHLICRSFLSFLHAIAPIPKVDSQRNENREVLRKEQRRCRMGQRADHPALRSQLSSLSAVYQNRVVRPTWSLHLSTKSSTSPETSSNVVSESHMLANFWKTLLCEFAPLLLECYRSCAPESLSTVPDRESVECMYTIVLVLRTVACAYHQCSGNLMGQSDNPSVIDNDLELRKLADQIWQYIGPYFPLPMPILASSLPHQVANSIRSLNAVTCECLSSLFPLLPTTAATHPFGHAVLKFLVEALDDGGEVLVDHKLRASSMAVTLDSKSRVKCSTDDTDATKMPARDSLLSSLRNALPYVDVPHRVALLRSLHGACADFSSDSPERAEFLVMFNNFPTLLHLCGSVGNRQVDMSFNMTEQLTGIVDWIREVPRLLWEAKTVNRRLTKACLRLLLEAGRQATPGSDLHHLLGSVRPQLSHFFGSVLEQEGEGSPIMVYGPFMSLDMDLQEEAVLMLAQLGSLVEPVGDAMEQEDGNTGNILQALALCCLSCSLPPHVVTQILALVMDIPDDLRHNSGYNHSSETLLKERNAQQQILSFGITIVRGKRPNQRRSGKSKHKRNWLRDSKLERGIDKIEALQKRRSTVEAVSRHMSNLASQMGLHTLIGALEQPLMELLEISQNSGPNLDLEENVQEEIEGQRNALNLLCSLMFDHCRVPVRGESAIVSEFPSSLLKRTMKAMFDEMLRRVERKSADGDKVPDCIPLLMRVLIEVEELMVYFLEFMENVVKDNPGSDTCLSTVKVISYLFLAPEISQRLQHTACRATLSSLFRSLETNSQGEDKVSMTLALTTARTLGFVID